MKKRIVIMMTMALVGLLAVGGTMAWFTAKAGPITNSFKAGTVDIELRDIFDEAKAQNVNPGDCYDKVVYVENIGSKSAYIRVKLTPEFKSSKPVPRSFDYNLVQYRAENWEDAWVEIDGWYYYKSAVEAQTGRTTNLVNKVCFDGSGMDNMYQGVNFTLTVEAEAIQASNEAINDLWKIDPKTWEKIGETPQ